MSKIILNDVTNIDSITTINDNFDKIEQELQNKVWYRNNPVGEPNGLVTNVDFNGKDLLNVGTIFTADGSAFASADQIYEVQNAVEADRGEVAANKAIVEADKNTTVAAKDAAVAALDSFDDRYLGVKSADPALDNDGNTLQQGALYFNDQAPKQMKVYNGSAWQAVATFSNTTTTSIDGSLYASQVEAEQGINNTKVLTPLRTAQAIAASPAIVHRTGDETIAGVKTFSSSPNGTYGKLVATTVYVGGRTGGGAPFNDTYTFTANTLTRFVEVVLVGGSGSSGSLSSGASGTVQVAPAAGAGAYMRVRFNSPCSGATITLGSAPDSYSGIGWSGEDGGIARFTSGSYEAICNGGLAGGATQSITTFPTKVLNKGTGTISVTNGTILDLFYDEDPQETIVLSTTQAYVGGGNGPKGAGKSKFMLIDANKQFGHPGLPYNLQYTLSTDFYECGASNGAIIVSGIYGGSFSNRIGQRSCVIVYEYS